MLKASVQTTAFGRSRSKSSVPYWDQFSVLSERVPMPKMLPQGHNTTQNYFFMEPHELPAEMVYGFTNTVIIVVYSFLMLTSLLVNSVFLVILIRRRHRTRTHYLMINLCLSNFYLVLLEMPLQIAWNATVFWAGNDGLCRALSYFSIIGMYGNAFFTVAIALDRWQSISKAPVTKSCLFAVSKQRTRCMIALAWVMAHICSVPQAIIFHVEEHPKYKNFYQCVTFNYFRNQLDEIAYNICVSCLIYCVPLLALTACSVAIWLYIREHVVTVKLPPCSHKQGNGKSENGLHPPPASLSLSNRFQDRTMRFRCSTKRLLCRAEKQAFRLTVVFLTIFMACHTPYQIISVWRVLNPALGNSLNPIIHRLLFACGVLPTIVDPIAYAKFLIPITNELKVIMSRRMRSIGRRSRGNNELDAEVELTKLSGLDVAKGQQLSLENFCPTPRHLSVTSSSKSVGRTRKTSWL